MGSVALRKESVDRNTHKLTQSELPNVALRKESVDRNDDMSGATERILRRSPQGERG